MSSLPCPGRFYSFLIYLCFGVYCILSSQARAQQSPGETGASADSILPTYLQEVVLTATRTERQVSSLPLPVTLVAAEQIEKAGAVRLGEILNEQTGIITVADESGFEGVQIQGVAADYILILMDGVPLVGRSAGNFDLQRLAVGNIKQVEVVKGPSSSLYGSEALGGVINIITEKPNSEDLKGSASYRIGRFAQQDMNLDLKQRKGDFRYGLFANRFSSEGYDLSPETPGQTVNPFENYTLQGRFYFDFSEQFTLFTSARFYDQLQDAGFTTGETEFEGDSHQREWNLHARGEHAWSEALQTEYELYYTNYLADERIADPLTDDVLSDSDFDQRMLRPEIRGTYTFRDGSKLTVGAGLQFEQLDRTFFDDKVRFDSQYTYMQYDFNPVERVNVIAGARYDNHSEYNDQLSPKLAIRYRLSDAIALKGSIGYGFKAPDFRQLYFDFTNSTVGYTVLGYNVAAEKLAELDRQGQINQIVVPVSELDEPLRAESSIGYNLGMTFGMGRWNGELNVFRNDFSNLIDTRIIASRTNGQNVFSYVNFDEIFTTGGEVNATYRFTDNVNLSAGYQLLFAYDKAGREAVADGSVFARDETNQTVALDRSEYFGLPNRSRHNANIKLYWNVPQRGLDFNLRLLYRSRYAQFDTNGNGLIDTYDTSFVGGFLLANTAVSKRLLDDFTVQVGANNLFGFTDPNIPSQPGRVLFTRINYQF